MKKQTALIGFCMATLIANAQIKVWPGGYTAVGFTNVAPFSGFRLHITGHSVFSASTAVPASSAFIRGLNTYSTATTPDYTWWGNDQTGMFHPGGNIIGFSTAGTERMRISPLTGVRVHSNGDWAPSLVLNATTANAVGYTMEYGGNATFLVHASGWIYSQGQYLGSDRSFKKDIATISGALDKVMRLRGVTYRMNWSGTRSVFNTGETYMGVVAQEVDSIVPEVVKTMPNGTKAVAYQNLVALLIEAVKEQNARIGELEAQITDCCSGKGQNMITPGGEQGMNMLPGGDGTMRESSSSNMSALQQDATAQARLMQNTPNPFDRETQIEYFLPETVASASLLIFDLQGKLIKTIPVSGSGRSSITINAGELHAGMFIYTLVANGKEVDSKRMILTE